MNQKKSLWKIITGSREVSLLLILIVMLVIVQILSRGTFLTPTNIGQIFRNNALTMLMALGMLCVMLTAGIDISITSTTAVTEGTNYGIIYRFMRPRFRGQRHCR